MILFGGPSRGCSTLGGIYAGPQSSKCGFVAKAPPKKERMQLGDVAGNSFYGFEPPKKQ
jgi:hypothetical protein